MANGKKTCFVVMGFGEKTDFQSNPQRVLDLNRTFENIIEPSVTASGLECIRADKIIHSTVIDKPMYENLLAADVVIADLSTSNANAIYELGVRHALRPHTTIVMAENGFSFPFDFNHLAILRYEHLGKDIGFTEAMRMQGELKERLAALVAKPDTDSPVFLFLPSLLGQPSPPAAASTAAPRDEKSFAELMQALRDAKAAVRQPSDWLAVVAVVQRLMQLQPNDSYIVQQMALATYKSKYPDALSALRAAKQTLQALAPETSSDVETIGLWGAIHKRLWEVGADPQDLAKAIRAYGRGYFIRNDYYTGINFAFLLNVRAARSQGDDAIADRVVARRIRDEVVTLCDAALATGALNADDTFWAGAAKVEALLGSGRKAEAEQLRQQLAPPQPWMRDSMDEQLGKLAALEP